MANTGSNGGGKRFLPVTAFNTAQFEPSAVIYEISTVDFQNAVLDIARTFIDEFEGCIYERGRNHHDALMLWLPANSAHLIDRKSTEGTILTRATARESQQMKEFKARFCKEVKDGPPVKDSTYRYGTLHMLATDAASSSKISAIVVNPKPFMDLIFDVNGEAYKKANPDVRTLPRVELKVESIYGRPHHRDGSTRLIGFKVQKTVRARRGELHTKHAIDI